jgi:outer membrane lipoprotein-sorting protein
MLLHRRRFALLLPALSLPRGRAVAQASQQHPQAAIDDLMQMLALVSESNASFVEVKTLAMLTRPLRASGRLAYRRPAHLEKITQEPQAESLVVDGDKLTLTEAGITPRAIDLNGEPIIHALVDSVRGTLSGDLAVLRRSYAVTMAGTVANWRLTLTPIDANIAGLVVRMTIEGSGTALRLVHTTQANGDETRMTISDVR